MTDQQKKAVEEAAEKFAEQDLDTSAWTDHTHDDHCLIWERQNSFQYGAEEVLNNLEKYGLVSQELHNDIAEKWKDGVNENARLREALHYLMEGVRGLPSLTAIAGTLVDHYDKAQEVLKGGETK